MQGIKRLFFQLLHQLETDLKILCQFLKLFLSIQRNYDYYFPQNTIIQGTTRV